MEKQRPEVTIESAEPVSDSSSQSSQSEDESLFTKRPQRLNAYANEIKKGRVPKGMRPANSSLSDEEEEEEIELERERTRNNNTKEKLLLTHPLVLVAASIGLGILISWYGVGLLKPAVDKVVEAAEEIVEESD